MSGNPSNHMPAVFATRSTSQCAFDAIYRISPRAGRCTGTLLEPDELRLATTAHRHAGTQLGHLLSRKRFDPVNKITSGLSSALASLVVRHRASRANGTPDPASVTPEGFGTRQVQRSGM